jgi:hypothetical protein
LFHDPKYSHNFGGKLSEAAIMSDRNVTITKTLAVVNNVSYPTNTISAIAVREIPPSLTWLVLCIVIGLASLLALANSAFLPALVGAVIVGLIVYFRPTMSYNLMVRSAGADTSVLTSKDSGYLGSVKSAIEEAVRQRG